MNLSGSRTTFAARTLPNESVCELRASALASRPFHRRCCGQSAVGASSRSRMKRSQRIWKRARWFTAIDPTPARTRRSVARDSPSSWATSRTTGWC